MRVPSHPTLIRRMIDSRLRRLGASAPVLAASLSLVHKRCGQPSCSCHKGGAAHPAWHVSFKEGGKTRTLYVPKDLVDDVQSWAEEHQRLKNLLGEINQLTLALIRTHSQHSKRKKGRP